MISLSTEFKQRITGTFGQEGKLWLRQLPSLLEDISHRWSLTLLPPFENLSYNYAAPALRKDGSGAVLKMGVPNKELTSEIEALRLMDGAGVVQILESEHALGAILLERLEPGQPVYEWGDDEAATAVAAQVMQNLWRSVPKQNPFPSVSDWARGFQRLRACFDGDTGPFPRALVEAAESIFDDLLLSSSDPVLLHGDLHHWNILSAEREPWLAIDPKGVIGEPAYEVGAWLRNPFPQILSFENARHVTSRRIAQFSELLGIDKQRLQGWGSSQAVLAGWWSYEDNGNDWETWVELAQLLGKP